VPVTVAATDFHREARRNQWRAAGLLAWVVAAPLLLGVVVGAVAGSVPVFGGLGLLAGVGLALVAYFASEGMVLSRVGARPADAREQPRYHNLVEGICVAAGIPKPPLLVIEDAAPNALVAGRSPRHCALAVTSGLLAQMNRVELEAVLAQELSQIKRGDMLPGTVAVVVRGVFRIVPPLAARLTRLATSPERELLADASSVLITRYPPGLSSALRKLGDGAAAVEHAGRATAPLWIASPLAPPLEERIRVLEAM
jgi:heat shock protein HtpX